jgi:hypothetical protein
MCFVPGLLFGGDVRTKGMDFYIIFDATILSSDKKAEAIDWVSANIVDKMLTNGDKLVIWSVSRQTEIVFNSQINGPEQKQEVKAVLQGLKSAQGGSSDYSGALSEASAMAMASSRPVYALLISRNTVQSGSSQAGSLASLLRYAKTDNFSGWRAITVGLGIKNRVQRETAAFMNTRR